MNWAIIDSTRRVSAIVAQDTRPENGVLIHPDTPCRVGLVYNGWEFIPPRWTAYQFLLRFTPAERAAFRSGATVDPVLADFLQLAQAAQEVDAGDPITGAGMQYLVSVGVLTEARRKEVLDEP